MGWGCGDICARDRRRSLGVGTVELVADRGELPQLEFAHAQAAPTFGRPDQGGIDQLEHGAFAERVRDDLGASPCLTEQPLE